MKLDMLKLWPKQRLHRRRLKLSLMLLILKRSLERMLKKLHKKSKTWFKSKKPKGLRMKEKLLRRPLRILRKWTDLRTNSD